MYDWEKLGHVGADLVQDGDRVVENNPEPGANDGYRRKRGGRAIVGALRT